MKKIDISTLLSNVLSSTLQAEHQGFEQYLSILQEIERMKSVSFSYYDDEGKEQRLEVPMITLIPLTMLHIEEAIFDFALNISEEKEETEIPIASQLYKGNGDFKVSISPKENGACNLKVKIEMGQSDLTSGLIAMLQRKSNSLN